MLAELLLWLYEVDEFLPEGSKVVSSKLSYTTIKKSLIRDVMCCVVLLCCSDSCFRNQLLQHIHVHIPQTCKRPQNGQKKEKDLEGTRR